ncbi:unnamed protein product [Prorocentrum cordatum]|uniref:Altered inheritance of mitochondria protein 24, mitochondrial n=1 Tax=Prorocentrum cordatum TaxID=2364126 RepID=A0ABN9QAB8_9DINO|nr:unnamed protein product [Polarella glacialis]
MPGAHVLLNVPMNARPMQELLRVDADAQKVGGACAETYFMNINITGKWVEAKVHKLGRGSGLMFNAGVGEPHTGTKWMTFGKIMLKVVHGRTSEGTAYLNFFARNLKMAGFLVGGLLGEDQTTTRRRPRRPGRACRPSRSELMACRRCLSAASCMSTPQTFGAFFLFRWRAEC